MQKARSRKKERERKNALQIHQGEKWLSLLCVSVCLCVCVCLSVRLVVNVVRPSILGLTWQ